MEQCCVFISEHYFEGEVAQGWRQRYNGLAEAPVITPNGIDFSFLSLALPANAQQHKTFMHSGHIKSNSQLLTFTLWLQNGMRPVDLASTAGYNHIVEYLTSIDTAAQMGKLQQYSKYL